MKLPEDNEYVDIVQLNIVVPKAVREDFKEACDFRRISQRQQLIFLMQDYVDAIQLEREKL